MRSFIAIFDQMLFLFSCILIGYLLRKTDVIPEESATVVSRIENSVCIPALILSITLSNNDIQTLATNSVTILYAAVVVVLSCVAEYILAPMLTKNPGHVGIFRYAVVFANFGFMGQAVIQGVFGNKVLYTYFFFQFPAAIVLYTLGIGWLSGKKGKFALVNKKWTREN